MTDLHIHTEKTPMPGFGAAQIRAIIIDATGFEPDLPATVRTGCGLRRAPARTSGRPEDITCLPCREWLHAHLLEWADRARSDRQADLAELLAGPARRCRKWRPSSADLLREEHSYRKLAARLGVAR